jgi:hypothetical protein
MGGHPIFWTEENLEFIRNNFGKTSLDDLRQQLQQRIKEGCLKRRRHPEKPCFLIPQVSFGGIIWKAFTLNLITAEERDGLIKKFRAEAILKTRGKGLGFSREVKKQALERDGYRCVICGSKEALSTDHKKELWESEEKDNSLENAQTLCRKCNMKKHHRVRRGKNWLQDAAYRKEYNDLRRKKMQNTKYAQRGKCRNNPCPCGSGIKFKKCCWGKPA